MAHDNPMFVLTCPEEATNVFDTKSRENSREEHLENQPEPEEKKTKCFRLEQHLSKMKWPYIVNPLLVASLITFIFVMESDTLKFKRLGFWCKDPNLSHKYRGDAVPFWYLIAISIVIPVILMFTVESVNSLLNYYSASKNKLLKLAGIYYGQYLIGFVVLLLLVQLAKTVISEPRPHFFDTCAPDKGNCTSGYITVYKCTNKKLPPRVVRDSHMSFPSGHAAVGLYMAAFLCWYLQIRVPQSSYLIVPWLQSLLLAFGLYCALSRITDRRHHWWDVLAGACLGIFMAVYAVRGITHKFNRRKTAKSDKNNETDSSTWSRKYVSHTAISTQPRDSRELKEVK